MKPKHFRIQDSELILVVVQGFDVTKQVICQIDNVKVKNVQNEEVTRKLLPLIAKSLK